MPDKDREKTAYEQRLRSDNLPGKGAHGFRRFPHLNFSSPRRQVAKGNGQIGRQLSNRDLQAVIIRVWPHAAYCKLQTWLFPCQRQDAPAGRREDGRGDRLFLSVRGGVITAE